MPPKSTSTKRKRAAESQSDTQFTFKQELRDIAAKNLVPLPPQLMHLHLTETHQLKKI
ncbi:hypothetical protein K469DRAFT_794501 [Zopfia rhizophila CBS 207.26]|uniref:Uncharacterized protein n=1 Tax=Zopfia rhizophila CBS 207.26 TaxID=1314779 RepID=A0A6A6D9Q3_9PEZI|nr:hypothetical protein K469DRAFT_794501 [Zopfia rhizophila CBS 207.26]